MASDKKIIDEVGESSHDTPQAITITIMDPSALEATDLDSSLVTSVETQDDRHGTSTLLVVPGDGHASISVEHGAKNILQTVTETHMGTHELPVISNISNPEEETSEQNSIHVTKTSQIIDEGEGVDEEDGEEPDESVGQHCLICNVDLPSEESTEPVLVFKTQTTTTQRKMSVFLGSLIGQKLTSRKAHSDIMCHRCFGLLDRVDSLEVEIRDTKEEIVNKYQETVAVYGGRARRRKPATAKKTDYVFPKVEPEDEDEQVLGLEMDENFEPRVEDLMEEENDHREDRSTQDEEWEPEFKKPRIKREAVDAESSGPTKRKRGRPRKDAAKPKGEVAGQHLQRLRYQMTTNNVGIQHSKDIPETDPDNDSHLHALELEGTSSKGAVDGLGTACETHSSGSNIHHLKIKLSTSLSKQCPACSSIFQSHLSLRNHLKNAHFDLEFLKCLHCSSEIYGNYEMFLDHLRSHLDQEGEEAATGSEAKTQECQVCHKQVRKINFLRHLASHKKVPCPECKTHILPHNLKRHVNDCHTRGRNYPCPDCPTMYHDASSLLSHRKRNHFGDETRHHLCKVCSKKFLSPSDLRIHMNGVHNNIKRFVCEFCGLGFKVSSALLYHRRLHTGERPHSCSKCERSFHIPSYLKRHLKRDHQEEYLGVYYKKGQPKSREDRSRARRHGSHLPSTAVPFINEPSISKQEVLEITVPTEMD